MKRMLFMKSLNGNSLVYSIDCQTALDLWEPYYDKVYVYHLLRSSEETAKRAAIDSYYRKLVRHKNTQRVSVPRNIAHSTILCVVCNFEAGDPAYLSQWVQAVDSAVAAAGVDCPTNLEAVNTAIRGKSMHTQICKQARVASRYICPYEQSAILAHKLDMSLALSLALAELIAARYGSDANIKAVKSIRENAHNRSLATQIAINEALLGHRLQADTKLPVTDLYMSCLSVVRSAGVVSGSWALSRDCWACIDYLDRQWYKHLSSMLGQTLPDNMNSVLQLPV